MEPAQHRRRGPCFLEPDDRAHRPCRQYLAAGIGTLPDGRGRSLLHAALQLDHLGPVPEGAAAARPGHIRHRQLDRLHRPVPDRRLDRRPSRLAHHVRGGRRARSRAGLALLSHREGAGARRVRRTAGASRAGTVRRDRPLPRRVADLPVHPRRRHLHGREYLRRRGVDADLPRPRARPQHERGRGVDRSDPGPARRRRHSRRRLRDRPAGAPTRCAGASAFRRSPASWPGPPKPCSCSAIRNGCGCSALR